MLNPLPEQGDIMTPTQQDNELREAILLEFKNVHRLAPADYTENCTNVVMQLITADRKRVALEARIETVMSIDAMLRFENIPLQPVQSESLKQYIRQLEAQQEEA